MNPKAENQVQQPGPAEYRKLPGRATAAGPAADRAPSATDARTQEFR